MSTASDSALRASAKEVELLVKGAEAIESEKSLGLKLMEMITSKMPSIGGAIDVMVVRQPDGSFKSSPFHVRFPAWLFRPRHREVFVEVNGVQTPVVMALGHTGNAYFVEEASSVEVRENMALEDDAASLTGMMSPRMMAGMEGYDSGDEASPRLMPKEFAAAVTHAAMDVQEAAAKGDGKGESQRGEAGAWVMHPFGGSPPTGFTPPSGYTLPLGNRYTGTASPLGPGTPRNAAPRPPLPTPLAIPRQMSPSKGQGQGQGQGHSQGAAASSLSPRLMVEPLTYDAVLKGARLPLPGTSPTAAGRHEPPFPAGSSAGDVSEPPASVASSLPALAPPLAQMPRCALEDMTRSTLECTAEVLRFDLEHERLLRGMQGGAAPSVPPGGGFVWEAGPLEAERLRFLEAQRESDGANVDLAALARPLGGPEAEGAEGDGRNGGAGTVATVGPSSSRMVTLTPRASMGDGGLGRRTPGAGEASFRDLSFAGGSPGERDPRASSEGSMVSANDHLDDGAPSTGAHRRVRSKGEDGGIDIQVELDVGDGGPGGGSRMREAAWSFWPFASGAGGAGAGLGASSQAGAGAGAGQARSEGGGSRAGAGSSGEGSRAGLRYVKTMTPTSRDLAAMGLRPGQNEVVFRCQGGAMKAYMYVYEWDARLVVSDIDGTITRSDVMGHVMTAVGRDWTHRGIAELFRCIKRNGYEVMYLSSRSISQAASTRDFLHNLRQPGSAEDHSMPLGPVILSPDGLFRSVTREVILRRPHEFKIAALTNIRRLFPLHWSPFYAGFGNRVTDEVSYIHVGVPRPRVFTINPKGEISQVTSAARVHAVSSLRAIRDNVDAIFPAYRQASAAEGPGEEGGDERGSPPKDTMAAQEEFSDLLYWKKETSLASLAMVLEVVPPDAAPAKPRLPVVPKAELPASATVSPRKGALLPSPGSDVLRSQASAPAR